MASVATLRDVAEMAGVSVGTASQAINNKPNVSPETRTRVIEAAIALGYQVKMPTVSTSEKPLSMIGMLVMHDVGTEVAPNIFYSHIQSGVESECRKQGISLMFSTIDVDCTKHPLEWPALVRDERIEGLVILGAVIEDTMDRIQKMTCVPVVMVDGYAPNLPFDTVNIENYHGAYSAVDYLVKQGHRQIGLIGWRPDAHASLQERRAGYLRALKANGIEEAFIEPSILQRDSAVEAFKRMIQKNPKVSAIFACNDDSAVGILNCAREMGFRLPEDLSVVGFDNTDISKEVTPALTTVHVHKAWMGMIGVRHLIARVQNPDQPKVSTRIITQLIIRDSVAPHLS